MRKKKSKNDLLLNLEEETKEEKKEEIKKMITPIQFESIYGIPRGSLANMRFKKIGPKFCKAGKKRILYSLEDVEIWLHRKEVDTRPE